jgi:predicted choloylglycine hydrolase
MGEQHAEQLGPTIKKLYRGYFDSYFGSEFKKQMVLMVAGAFEQRVSPEHREEIHALAAKNQMDEREVMLGQCFLDATPMVACSTVTLPASASSDGVARFARNLDFPGFDIADQSSVLLVFHPKDRFAFASLAWPGMLGVISGMNEHGLTLANMEVQRPQRLPTGMPYMLLYRTVLERCKTVEEAIDLLQKTTRQTSNNLMLMDANGDRAVCEITPEKVTVRRAPETQVLISTNHHRGTELDRGGRCERFDYLHEAGAKDFGHVDVEMLKQMLGKVAQGRMTLQSMVFEPKGRVMYLAVGAEAPKQRWGRVELSKLFLKRK